jgi:hypothetical protein
MCLVCDNTEKSQKARKSKKPQKPASEVMRERNLAAAKRVARELAVLLSDGQSVEKLKRDLTISDSDKLRLREFLPVPQIQMLAEFREMCVVEFDRLIASPELDAITAETVQRRAEVRAGYLGRLKTKIEEPEDEIEDEQEEMFV